MSGVPSPSSSGSCQLPVSFPFESANSPGFSGNASSSSGTPSPSASPLDEASATRCVSFRSGTARRGSLVIPGRACICVSSESRVTSTEMSPAAAATHNVAYSARARAALIGGAKASMPTSHILCPRPEYQSTRKHFMPDQDALFRTRATIARVSVN